jgi:hypothetical protein
MSWTHEQLPPKLYGCARRMTDYAALENGSPARVIVASAIFI